MLQWTICRTGSRHWNIVIEEPTLRWLESQISIRKRCHHLRSGSGGVAGRSRSSQRTTEYREQKTERLGLVIYQSTTRIFKHLDFLTVMYVYERLHIISFIIWQLTILVKWLLKGSSIESDSVWLFNLIYWNIRSIWKNFNLFLSAVR